MLANHSGRLGVTHRLADLIQAGKSDAHQIA